MAIGKGQVRGRPRILWIDFPVTLLRVVSKIFCENIKKAKSGTLGAERLQAVVIALVLPIARLGNVLQARILAPEILNAAEMVDMALGGDDILDVIRVGAILLIIGVVHRGLIAHTGVHQYIPGGRFNQIAIGAALGHHNEIVDALTTKARGRWRAGA